MLQSSLLGILAWKYFIGLLHYTVAKIDPGLTSLLDDPVF